MPNLKIHVDDAIWAEQAQEVSALLEPIRRLLCSEFRVDAAACQLAILPVRGLADQPQVAVEIHIMPKMGRTREQIAEVCRKLRELLANATGAHVAVRVASLDPETYFALK